MLVSAFAPKLKAECGLSAARPGPPARLSLRNVNGARRDEGNSRDARNGPRSLDCKASLITVGAALPIAAAFLSNAIPRPGAAAERGPNEVALQRAAAFGPRRATVLESHSKGWKGTAAIPSRCSATPAGRLIGDPVVSSIARAHAA